MHALILTALLTGATAFGVTGYNNAQPKAINNNKEFSQVQRSYYDADNVSEYGTGASVFYNYLYDDGYILLISLGTNAWFDLIYTESGDAGGIATNDDGRLLLVDNESGVTYTTFYLNTSPNADGTSYTGDLDLYYNGAFMATLSAVDNAYTLPILEGYNYNSNSDVDGYVWLFQHTETPMEQGIFNVVGDTITAFAGTIGVGISSMISIFYNEGITPLGILALITLGVALVWFAWNLVSSLLRQRR